MHATDKREINHGQCPFGFCLLCSINDLTINLLIKSAQGQSEYKNDLPHLMPWIEQWQDARTQAVRTSIRDGWQKTSRKTSIWQRRLRHPRVDNDCRTRNAATTHHASGHYRLQANMSRHGASDSDSQRGSGLISNGLPQGTSRPAGIGLNSCSAAASVVRPAAEGISFTRTATVAPDGDVSLSAAEIGGGGSAKGTAPPSSRDSGSQERWIEVSLGRRCRLTAVDQGMSARRR
jgi:hypothetical protein